MMYRSLSSIKHEVDEGMISFNLKIYENFHGFKWMFSEINKKKRLAEPASGLDKHRKAFLMQYRYLMHKLITCSGEHYVCLSQLGR